MNDNHLIITKKYVAETGVACAMCYRDSVVLDDTEFEDFNVEFAGDKLN